MKFGGAPKCAGCDKSVYAAEEVVALGRKYHIRCLKCESCSKKLEALNTCDKDSHLYCNTCYARLFGPKGYGFGGGAGALAMHSEADTVADEAAPLAGPALRREQKRHPPPPRVPPSRAPPSRRHPPVPSPQVRPVPPSRRRQGVVPVPRHSSAKTPAPRSPSPLTGAARTTTLPTRVSTAQPAGDWCSKCQDRKLGRFCNSCGTILGEAPAGARPPAPPVRRAPAKRVAPKFGGGMKCARCTKTVYDAEMVQGPFGPMHTRCHTCAQCKTRVTATTLCDNGTDIYCKSCYSKLL